MKKIMKKFMLSLALVIFSVTMFADNGGTKFMDGTTKGNIKYSIHLSEDAYYFQGNTYEVFDVHYSDSLQDVKIAVYDNCYVVYNKDFTVFYGCDKNGFGIRKIMFSNPYSGENLNEREYNRQTILVKKDINEYSAIGLIATFFPNLEINEKV